MKSSRDRTGAASNNRGGVQTIGLGTRKTTKVVERVKVLGVTETTTLPASACGQGGGRTRKKAGPGESLVTCWCENQIMVVSQDDVYRGRTVSCGSAKCDVLAVKHG